MSTPEGLGARARHWLTAPEHRPARLLAATALLAAALGYVVAVLLAARGFAPAPGVQRSELAQLRADNRQLSRELTRLRTDSEVDRAAYDRVGKQLSELQDKILEQQEEVSFYRGVVGGAGESGIQVKDFSLLPGTPPAVRLGFVAAQIESAQREVQGQIQIRIEAERDGRLVSIDAATLVPAGQRKLLNFRFRYFTEVTLDLAMPPGLVPKRVVIRVQPSARGLRASVVSFPWVSSTT